MKIRVVPQSSSRMYAAAQVSRLTTDWPITITSADSEIHVSAIATRSRLRQLERDDDYMRNMLWVLENNVIGEHGIMPRMRIKKGKGTATKLNAKTQQAWKNYFEPENCTVMRNMTGVEVERLAIRRLAVDGGILFRKHRAFNNPFMYALEPIEIDRLDHWYTRPAPASGNEIRFGVEMDQYRAHVAYWILTRHPGDVFAWQQGTKYRERVPADEIFALWITDRAGQSIGMPMWPSVANRLHHLSKYEESESIAARVSANKGGWFEHQDSGGEYVGDQEDQQGNKLVNTEPGQWEELPRGWKAVQNDPSHPVDAFAAFVKQQLRGASSGANLPYNSVANDLEGVNYSSIRAGLLDARDGFRYLQKMVHHKFVKLWFKDWLPYAILSGQLDTPITKMEKILKGTHWQGRRWPWVDPLKDVQADILAIQNGLDSRRNILADRGMDIEETFQELEQDEDLADCHGLNFSVTDQVPTIKPSGDDDDDPPKKGRSIPRYEFALS